MSSLKLSKGKASKVHYHAAGEHARTTRCPRCGDTKQAKYPMCFRCHASRFERPAKLLLPPIPEVGNLAPVDPPATVHPGGWLSILSSSSSASAQESKDDTEPAAADNWQLAQRSIMRQALSQHRGRAMLGGRSMRFHRMEGVSPVYRTFVNQEAQVTSNGSGLIQNGFHLLAGSGFTDWSSLAAVFDLYRYVSAVVRYEPDDKYQQNSSVAFLGGLLGVVFDPDNASSSIAWATMLGYDTMAQENHLKITNTADSWQYHVRFPSEPSSSDVATAGQGTWLNTGSPLAAGYLYITSDTNVAFGVSKTFGTYLVSLELEFAIRQ